MKRPVKDPSRYYRPENFSALVSVDPERLKLLGAVGVEFTSLERLVDYSLHTLLRLDIDETDVVSRINGFDGKVGIIKSTAQSSATLRGEPAALISNTLAEVGIVKTYRDAVAHADIHEPKAELVLTSIKHGKPYEVDISIPTLKALCARIEGLQTEMLKAIRVIEHHFTKTDLEMNDYESASDITDGQAFQDHLREFRECQSNRKSLPTIPQLTEEPPSQPAKGGS